MKVNIQKIPIIRDDGLAFPSTYNKIRATSQIQPDSFLSFFAAHDQQKHAMVKVIMYADDLVLCRRRKCHRFAKQNLAKLHELSHRNQPTDK